MPTTRRQLFGLPRDGLAGAGVTAAVAVGAVVALDACTPPPPPTKAPLHTYSYRQLNGYRRDLMICDATGRNLTNILPSVYGRAAWTPKGDKLAVSRAMGDDTTGTWALWVCTRAGKSLQRITSPASGIADLDPTFAPDGFNLAFTRDTIGFGSGQGIWTVTANGLRLRPVPGAAGGITPSIVPDSQDIVYAARDGIRRIPFAGGSSRLIYAATFAWQATQPTVSPDGKRVAFIRKGSGTATDLSVVNAGGGGFKAVQAASIGLETPAWLSDSNTLTYARFAGAGAEGRSNVVVLQQTIGHTFREVFRPFGGTPTDLSTWSP
jgi:Tol biopolymer transport system component